MVYRDYYHTSSPWYYVLQISVLVYAAGLVANLVLVMNTSVIDTIFRTLPGGTPYSLKWHTFQWFIFMIANMKYFMPILMNQMILYRKSRGCSILWFVFLFIIVMFDLFVVLGLLRFYSACNGQGQPDNPCNSLIYCCAQDIYTISTNACPNSSPCPDYPGLTRDQLGANVDFKWYLAVSIVFLAFDLIFVGFFGGVFYISPLARVKGKNNEEEDNDNGNLKSSSLLEMGLNYVQGKSMSGKMTKGE
jgi:hypothetical protein